KAAKFVVHRIALDDLDHAEKMVDWVERPGGTFGEGVEVVPSREERANCRVTSAGKPAPLELVGRIVADSSLCPPQPKHAAAFLAPERHQPHWAFSRPPQLVPQLAPATQQRGQ